MREGLSREFAAISFLLAVALITSACGSADAAGPPEINYGRDICEQCGMIISEPRHASAYRLPSGDMKKFDDVGDMVVHGITSGELGTSVAWVHDFETEVWLDAEAAWYVAGTAIKTPMAHGIVAFALETSAQEFATQTGGDVYKWAEVTHLPVTNGLVGHHHMAPTEHMHDD